MLSRSTFEILTGYTVTHILGRPNYETIGNPSWEREGVPEGVTFAGIEVSLPIPPFKMIQVFFFYFFSLRHDPLES